jgi:hypothetical protein
VLLRFAIFIILGAPLSALSPSFQVIGTDAEPWNKLFTSIGFSPATDTDWAQVIVAGPSSNIDIARVATEHIVILEGDSAAARQAGIVRTSDFIAIRQIVDVHAPKMQIVWSQQVSAPATSIPHDFEIYTKERWKGAPLAAGKRTGQGAIVWIATPPGESGADRYPYLLHALADVGMEVPARTAGLWAFFDSSYRLRADVDYLARRWREGGISALHVAAWHNTEPDPQRDDYLKKLILACHRNAILVYAWLELPHVSEKFWADHPEWRERTAAGQDAQLDWRKLMNLQNRDCKRAVVEQVHNLLTRFDWDGVNMAELYFESLEGASNPARFTPMNDDVRRAFEMQEGFDPKLLFDPKSRYATGQNQAGLRKFLDFRAGLASRMQADWLDVLDQVRGAKPWLDVVLTHVDDRLEPGMRDALGADVERSLPAIQSRHATLLVEDPATLWDLGAARYAKLAEKYNQLTEQRQRLAVDINVVERYQDVYPTKKQTGTELFQLVHQAAQSFNRVALYFENSIEPQDWALLPAAGSAARVAQPFPDELTVESSQSVRIPWSGTAELDGHLWPIQNQNTVLVPPGKHRLTPGTEMAAVRLADFNGDLRSATNGKDSVELAYVSRSRAIAILGSDVSAIDVDGTPFWKPDAQRAGSSVLLPSGEHIVTLHR